MLKLLVATTLIFSASLASASCSRGHEEAMSCVEGSTFDSTTGTCVPVINS